MDGAADEDGPLHLRYSEEGDPARALAMLETETAALGRDGIDVLRKLLEQELHEQVGRALGLCRDGFVASIRGPPVLSDEQSDCRWC